MSNGFIEQSKTNPMTKSRNNRTKLQKLTVEYIVILMLVDTTGKT